MLRVSTAQPLRCKLAVMERNAQHSPLKESLAMLATTKLPKDSHRATFVKQALTASLATM